MTQVCLSRLIFPSLRQNLVCNSLVKQVPASTGIRSLTTEYDAYYKTLNLPASATKDQVRSRYFELAKLHRLDGDGAREFDKIDVAFKRLLVKFKEEKEEEKVVVDTKHQGLEMKREEKEVFKGDKHQHITQHWQLLDGGSHGVSNTPAQKQKQMLKDRALKANHAVHERRMGQHEEKHVTEERQMVRGHQTQNQMDRLVEDLIQQGMAKGAFDNLAGAGKPLPERPPDFNPYMDFTTHKMNQILVDTGFTPQWVELQKEIRLETEALRKELGKSRQSLGPAPLSQKAEQEWVEKVSKMEKNISEINKKIQKFNLIVPSIHHQKFPVNLAKEAEKIFANGFDPSMAPKKSKPHLNGNGTKKKSEGLFSSLFPSLHNKS